MLVKLRRNPNPPIIMVQKLPDYSVSCLKDKKKPHRPCEIVSMLPSRDISRTEGLSREVLKRLEEKKIELANL